MKDRRDKCVLKRSEAGSTEVKTKWSNQNPKVNETLTTWEETLSNSWKAKRRVDGGEWEKNMDTRTSWGKRKTLDQQYVCTFSFDIRVPTQWNHPVRLDFPRCSWCFGTTLALVDEVQWYSRSIFLLKSACSDVFVSAACRNSTSFLSVWNRNPLGGSRVWLADISFFPHKHAVVVACFFWLSCLKVVSLPRLWMMKCM